MDKRIFDFIDKINPERLWKHHRFLCREIGHRFSGTENEKRAAGYIKDHFKRWGLFVRDQEFPCPSWNHYNTEIKTGNIIITGNQGGACTFSLPCNVEGKTINLRTVKDLEGTDIKGKICVISGELRNAPIRLDRSPLLLLIEKKEPLALIIVDHINNGYQTKIIRDPLFTVPVCAVSANCGMHLLEDNLTVKVKIEAERFQSTSMNIFGSNTDTDEPKIRIMAHYDTASNTPGATDNTSGISIVLEAARAFMETGLEIPMEFIAFGAEEYALLGSRTYAGEHEAAILNTLLAINVDGIGACNSEPYVLAHPIDTSLRHNIRTLVSYVGGYHNIKFDEMKLSSDHEAFYTKGIPTIFLYDNPHNLIWDTTLDISRHICLERLEDAAKIVLGTALYRGLKGV